MFHLQADLRAVLLAFHKPYGVLSQFTPDGSPNRPLREFSFPPHVYPLGRLDADSEGLLLLSDEPGLNTRLLDPKHAHSRIYWAQVERIPTVESLAQLARGVVAQGRQTLPCRAWLLDPQPEQVGRDTPCAPSSVIDLPRGAHGVSRPTSAPTIFPRDPPIRFRKSVPDCWIGLDLIEGKNRQVRRMTAAIGHPTLRLIRVQIGQFQLGGLSAGKWRELTGAELSAVLE